MVEICVVGVKKKSHQIARPCVPMNAVTSMGYAAILHMPDIVLTNAIEASALCAEWTPINWLESARNWPVVGAIADIWIPNIPSTCLPMAIGIQNGNGNRIR